MKKKLKDICTIEKGKQIDTKLLADTSSYRYINGGIKESGFYNDFNTSGETVLISEGGASCGYVNYVNEKFWCGCHCYKLIDINVFPKFLFYALKASQNEIMAYLSASHQFYNHYRSVGNVNYILMCIPKTIGKGHAHFFFGGSSTENTLAISFEK